MLTSLRLPLLAACMLVMPTVAQADDAALAAKLVGAWEGRWAFGDAGGRFTLQVTGATGNALKGETLWYDTAVGDFKDRFSGAKLKGTQLKVSESTMDFDVKVSEDGLTLEGTWSSPMATGTLKAAKKTP